MIKEQLVNVDFICPCCRIKHYLYDLPKSKVDRALSRYETGEHIQDIFPHMSKANREKFITGYCDDCQKKIFDFYKGKE